MSNVLRPKKKLGRKATPADGLASLSRYCPYARDAPTLEEEAYSSIGQVSYRE